MERKCMRCGENMILDYSLALSEGAGEVYKRRQSYFVYKDDGKLLPQKTPIKIAICPKCGHLEPYIQYPQKLS